MSDKYKHGDRVPTGVLADRLDELADAVTEGPDVVKREFTMRVPAELDRDADLILSEAARRLREMSQPAEQERTRPDLQGFVHWLFTNVWPHGDADGGDLQDQGVKYGILRPVEATQPCGDHCTCAEWGDFPMTCYRLAIGKATEPAEQERTCRWRPIGEGELSWYHLGCTNELFASRSAMKARDGQCAYCGGKIVEDN